MSNNPLNSPEAEQYRQQFPKREIGVMMLKDAMGRYLFVRTHRLPQSWQPACGGREAEDGTLLDTAVRELKEETGLMIDKDKTTFLLEMPYDFGEGKVQFFQADLPTEQQLTIDEREIIETRWVTLDEAAQLPIYPATQTCVDLLRKQK